MTGPRHLERENEIVLATVQALLGLISSNVIAVAVQVADECIELKYWVRYRTAELDEDIDDAICDLDAFTDGRNAIEAVIVEGAPDPAQLRSYGRMVYWAK